MKERILKNWKTTMFGMIVIGYEIYKIIVLKESPNFGSALSLLLSMGFIGYKGKSVQK